MKKHPITWISLAAVAVLLACLFVAAFNSGLSYHTLYAEATMYGDAELISVIKQNQEHDNIFAVMHSIVSAFIVFLVWYVACAFIIIKRMRSVGIPLVRYGIPLLIFVGCARCVPLILDSRPEAYHYDEYIKCLIASFGVVSGGILVSAISLYFCCHTPWRKRITR